MRVTRLTDLQTILGAFEEHEQLLCQCKAELVPSIKDVGAVIRKAMLAGNKLMLCGNGGSAADAQHIAAELIGRFKSERRALPALALTTDSSILTAIGNDYSFDDIFSRQIRGMAQTGDVVIGISTSGNSGNVVNAVFCAKELKCSTIALVGHAGGKLATLCDYAIVVPSKHTARIQEMHITIGHILCELMEEISHGN